MITKEMFERFDRAARAWGYEEDQGTGLGTAVVMKEYEAAKADLLAAVSAIEEPDTARTVIVGEETIVQLRQGKSVVAGRICLLPASDLAPPPQEPQFFGPYGYLNGCRALTEDMWELENDPMENNEEYFSIPLYSKVDISFPVTVNSPAPQPVSVKALEWSEPAEPNENCSYNHVIAKAVFIYQIEWKAWKKYDAFVVYRDGDYLDSRVTLEDATAAAQADYESRIRSALSSPVEGGTEKEEGRMCQARPYGTGGGDPQDCGWPMCGCDPHADKVIAALEESGITLSASSPSPVAYITKVALKNWLTGQNAEQHTFMRDGGDLRVPLYTASPSPSAEKEALRVEDERLKSGLARSTALRTSSGGSEQPSLSIYFTDLDAMNLFHDGVRKLCDEIIEERAALKQQEA